MYRTTLTFILIASVTFSAHLPPGPDPLEFAENNETELKQNNVTKRQIPWYLPVVTVPQIVQVHHVVYLQPPAPQCYPRQPPVIQQPYQPPYQQPYQPPYLPPYQPPVPSPTPGPMDDGLTNRMGGTMTNQTAESEPSRCVWAIVACCAPGSNTIRYTCFELLGCQGAFWDVNPCNTRVTMAAANTALRYYMKNTTSNEKLFDEDITTNLAQ